MLGFFVLCISISVAQQISTQSNRDLYYDATKEKIQGNTEKALKLFEKQLKAYPEDDASMYEIASIYFKQKKVDEALEYAGNAVSLNSENKWYKTLLIQIYQAKGDYRAASRIIQNMIETEPGNIEYLQDYALNYIYAGDFKDAIEVYDEIEEKMGITEQISLQKQKLYLLLKRPKEAIREVEALTRAYPDEARFLEMLAEMYVTSEKFDEALATYEKIREIDPDNPYINISLSDYYRKQGNDEMAFTYLKDGFANPALDIDTKIQILLAYYSVNEIYNELKDEAFTLAEILVEAHPDEAKAFSIYADLLYQDDRFDEARTAFRKVISLDSSKYVVWEQLLFIESELGDFEAMASEAARALALFPQQPLIYLFSGVANFQIENYEQSSTDLETGSQFVVGNNKLKAQFYSYLGDVYYQLDDIESAFLAYDETLKLDPGNSIVLNNYAYYLSLVGDDLPKAEEMARKAVDMDPENGANQDTYGWVLYKIGRYDEAKEWIGKAIENREESAVVLEHYGDVLFKLGDHKKAVKYWEKAQDKGEGSEFLDKKVRDKTMYE